MRQIDEIYSLRRFINGTLTGADVDKPTIYIERPRAPFKRPAFRIDNPTSIRVPATNSYWFDERTWMVTMYGRTREEAMRLGETWIDKIDKHPTQRKLIPLWIFSFPYYPPILRAVTVDPVTAFGAGTYSVQLVAENLIGQKTLASAVTSVALTAGQAIEVQIPLEPKGWPIGKKFHMYLSGTGLGAAHRVGAVTYTTNVDPVSRILADVPGGVADGTATALLSALSATSEVRYRYMRVLESQVENMEDSQEDKLWNHVVRLRTQTIGPREYTHEQLIGAIISTIE